MAILIIGINVYLVFYFLEDKTSSVCDWVFKVLCIFGLTIAWAQVLILPLDVSNARDGDLRIDLLWIVVYMCLFALVVFLLPFAMFYYESTEDDPVTTRL